MNFIKNSIFKRKPDEDTPEPSTSDCSGVLAVWGSPGSGKTTVAVKLAKHLADHKKNVALVFADMTAPMLHCVCPSSALECDRSLGSILAAAHVTEPLVKNNCVTLKKNPHLILLGLKSGENEYSYEYASSDCLRRFDCRRFHFATIIPDGTDHRYLQTSHRQAPQHP